MILNASEFFKQKARFLPIDLKVDEVEFTLIPLTDELIEIVKEADSSKELINLAADYGLAYYTGEQGKSPCARALDNAKMAHFVDELWEDEGIANSDPSIREAVGQEVIEVSGLSETLKELLHNEKEDVVLNGDGEMPLHEDLGKIQAEMNAQNNIQ